MSATDTAPREAVSALPLETEFSSGRLRIQLAALAALFKLRIVSLLLMAAIGGAFLGAEAVPGTKTLLLVVLTGGLAAAGASALNQYLERESDGKMTRTRKRPLVTGAIARPAWVPYVAAAMILAPALAVLPRHPALSFFLLAGAFIYVVIYTLWLKPRTLLNIVIGGAAGSAAVLSGSAAAGHWASPGALLLALLVFVWTPTHFWSLALVYKEDYRRADAPMLPTRATPRQAAFWIAVHSLATTGAALALVTHPRLGWIYVIPMILASADLLRRTVHLLQQPEARPAFSLFKASNLYLLLALVLICIDVLF